MPAGTLASRVFLTAMVPLPWQALAGVLDELALAAAAGAGLLGLHDAEGRTLLANDKASAAAVRAGLRAGTGGAAAAVALGTLLLTGDGDVLFAAMHRLIKRQGDAHPDVLALAGALGFAERLEPPKPPKPPPKMSPKISPRSTPSPPKPLKPPKPPGPPPFWAA